MRALALISLLALGLSACATTPKEIPTAEYTGYISKVEEVGVLEGGPSGTIPISYYVSTLQTETQPIEFYGLCMGQKEPSKEEVRAKLQDDAINYVSNTTTAKRAHPFPQRSIQYCDFTSPDREYVVSTASQPKGEAYVVMGIIISADKVAMSAGHTWHKGDLTVVKTAGRNFAIKGFCAKPGDQTYHFTLQDYEHPISIFNEAGSMVAIGQARLENCAPVETKDT